MFLLRTTKLSRIFYLHWRKFRRIAARKQPWGRVEEVWVTRASIGARLSFSGDIYLVDPPKNCIDLRSQGELLQKPFRAPANPQGPRGRQHWLCRLKGL